MAITADDVATTLTAAGIDSPEKFAAFLAAAGPLIERNRLLGQIETLREQQAQAAADAAAQAQGLQGRIDAIDRAFRGEGA